MRLSLRALNEQSAYEENERDGVQKSGTQFQRQVKRIAEAQGSCDKSGSVDPDNKLESLCLQPKCQALAKQSERDITLIPTQPLEDFGGDERDCDRTVLQTFMQSIS